MYAAPPVLVPAPAGAPPRTGPDIQLRKPSDGRRYAQLVLGNVSGLLLAVSSGNRVRYLLPWTGDVFDIDPTSIGATVAPSTVDQTAAAGASSYLTAVWVQDDEETPGTYPVSLTANALIASILSGVLAGTYSLTGEILLGSPTGAHLLLDGHALTLGLRFYDVDGVTQLLTLNGVTGSVEMTGVFEAVGASGARIVIDAGNAGWPTIRLLSPDGTNDAFVNLISGANSQAQLGINSGKFTPGDGVQRRFRLYGADDLITAQVMRESTQDNMGAFTQWIHDALNIGWEDLGAGQRTVLQFLNGTVQLFNETAGAPVDFFNGGHKVPIGALVNRKSTSAQGLTAAEVIDTGIGTFNPQTTFTAYAGRTYQIAYRARLQSDVAGVTGDVRVRDSIDGTATPPAPTAVSPTRAAASIYLAVAAGAGATSIHAVQTLDCPGDIAAGVHRLGCFYVKTAGPAGSQVAVTQSAGASRELTVFDVGSTA